MKPAWMITALVGAIAAGQPWVAFGQQKVDMGKREYDANCAVCHGASGKGDGPYRAGRGRSVPDLTTLAQKNNGVFPFARVYEFIDGTQMVKAHGTREMPIGAPITRSRARSTTWTFPYNPEVYVRATHPGIDRVRVSPAVEVA